MNAQRWDIFGFGIVAVDDLLTVENYPPPDAKTAVLEKSRQGGGLTGTALVAASRLGAKSAYGGVLGEDELSTWTLAELEREGVDCTPLHAVILAKKLGISTVADIERNEHPKTSKLIDMIDHLILSANFACKFTGVDGPVKAVESLHRRTRRACTAVTVGKEGCWYISAEKEGSIQHHPAFEVQVVDTTGCGDVFHGAYATGIACGWDVSRCIRFASAAAAIKATKAGGRKGIPDRSTVFQFLS
jgi:sugar/nucleoside kinase (ribokinase family)